MSPADRDPHNKGGLWAFVFSMIASFLFFFYVAFLHPGVDLNEVAVVEADESVDPQGIELAQFDPKQVSEPWVSTDELIGHGKQQFSLYCASCHGTDGAANSPTALALNPRPRNLIEGQWKKGGSSIELYTTLKNGFGPGSAMASFAHLPSVDRWAMIHWIRSITKNRIADDAEKLAAFAKGQN